MIIPTGRKIRITVIGRSISNNNTTGYGGVSIYDTSVAGTRLQVTYSGGGVTTGAYPIFSQVTVTPTATSKTYVAGIESLTAGTTTTVAGATIPTQMIVELV